MHRKKGEGADQSSSAHLCCCRLRCSPVGGTVGDGSSSRYTYTHIPYCTNTTDSCEERRDFPHRPPFIVVASFEPRHCSRFPKNFVSSLSCEVKQGVGYLSSAAVLYPYLPELTKRARTSLPRNTDFIRGSDSSGTKGYEDCIASITSNPKKSDQQTQTSSNAFLDFFSVTAIEREIFINKHPRLHYVFLSVYILWDPVFR